MDSQHNGLRKSGYTLKRFSDDRNRDRESVARLKAKENTLSQGMSKRNQRAGMVGVQ
jgi:hypothetical protein